MLSWFNDLRLAATAVFLVPVLANGTTNQLKMELDQAKPLQIKASFEASTTLQRTEQDGRDAYSRIILAPSYALNQDYRLGVSGSITQKFNEEQKTVYNNTKVTVARSPLMLTPDTLLFLVAGGRLPTNSDDRDNNTYRGALLVDPVLVTEWNLAGLRFSSTYRATLTRNFHKYDRNNLSEANTEYSIIHYGGLDFQIYDHVILTLDGDYTYARSYQSTANTAFSMGQSLTYQTPKWSVTVGHTNAADVLKSNGRDSNIAIYDDHTSAIYGALRVVY